MFEIFGVCKLEYLAAANAFGKFGIVFAKKFS